MADVSSNSPEGRVTTAGNGPEPIWIRSIVLLAGAVSASGLPAKVGRSVLDLPLSSSLRLLDVWRRRIGEFCRDVDSRSPDWEVVILEGDAHVVPSVVEWDSMPRVRAERDASGYRGTAGVLRDVCDGFGDDEHILVGNASQCPDEGLLQQLVAESDPADGVTLGAAADGAPSGLMLVRCGALRHVPSVGYIDLKEQALPRIAATFGVRVVQSQGGVAPPIRSLESYLDAVRSWHRSASLRGVNSVSPFEERWRPAFSVVEAGAQVAESARINDSVVLAGGVVEARCEVVRSVVGPGGAVRRGARVLDRLVLGSDSARADEPRPSPRSAR
jgi:hypothetical protein